MACLSCQKARRAAAASVTALARGDAWTAAGEAAKAVAAATEKLEALRIRRLTQRP